MGKNQPQHTLARQAEAIIPTPWGPFNMVAYAKDPEDWMPHIALVHPDVDVNEPVLTRIHSECITGDLFGSKRCDCGEQLTKALEMTAAEKGVVLYLRQEGRGIGIINKLKAYQLQDLGLNTIDANIHLGLEVDARQYDIAVAMLNDLSIDRIRLLTNNPEKIEAFDQSSIHIEGRAPLIIRPQQENRDYLKTKKNQMGHLFDLL
jgi:3,4-dihydroxy 2-butanone 4-phosphate synthase/GTP cyclohydrolase II